MAGGGATQSHTREPDPRRSAPPHMKAVNIFANDQNAEPIQFDDDEEGGQPIDNLAAPIGIITAVGIGLMLWVIIVLLVLWVK